MSVLDLFGHEPTGIGAVRCEDANNDPRAQLATDDPRRFEQIADLWKDIRDGLIEQRQAATTKQQKEALQEEIDGVSYGLNQLWAATADLAAAKEWKEERERNNPDRAAGDFPIPDPEGPTTARTVGSVESACAQVSEFVGECNRDGWTSPQCQELLDKMNKCLDPKVADPVPGEPGECSIPAITPDQVQDVLLAICTSKKKYGPDDNPCEFKLVPGVSREFGYRPRNGLDPCSDPRVRVTDEACLPTFTLVEFDKIDLDAIASWGLSKLGGPVFIFPTDEPRDDTSPAPKPPPFE
jgi:hypothetical protein